MKTFVHTVSLYLALFLGHQIIFVGCVVPILTSPLYKILENSEGLEMWNDEEYLQRKEERTLRDDKRDIIPNCIITESFFFILSTSHFILYIYNVHVIHAGNS